LADASSHGQSINAGRSSKRYGVGRAWSVPLGTTTGIFACRARLF
jgi:hypothetical protein